MTWALERTGSDDDSAAEMGWIILGGLLDSDLATDSERAIIEALAEQVAGSDTGDETDTTDGDQ
ncbi:hypothetical protein [Rhodococcoides fascians]|uniref:hypothetical protein n=1 Tax=Rhodococcoides fascians TaxID=1828 RepID=UPI000B17F4C8|nr:hypothetical protein [Rhodococcus fascians]